MTKMNSLFVISVLLLSACILSNGELSKIKLDKDGNFVDSNGRKALFHGFNSVQKGDPWYPWQMTNRTQLKMLQQWGMNVVRLGVMWSGVMPKKNTVDDKYLQKIEEIIDACADHGIYVLIDMHQDVLSSQFGTYDGLPTWFVDEICTVTGKHKYPWPYSRPPGQWFENYLTYSCLECAERLYTNASGAWLYWGDFWETVTKAYANKTNVIGYELINEPPPANFYTRPWRVLPGVVGKYFLLPVYDYLVERIRRFDKETLIFYEPVTFSVFFKGTSNYVGTGFERVPGSLVDPSETQRSVLSYHYYCWLLQTADPSRTMTWSESVICDGYLLPNSFINGKKSALKTGSGRFLTEFGLCGPDGNPRSINTIECSRVMEHADMYYESWAYWDGNFIDAIGNPIPTQVQAFSRTYPRYTKGRENAFKFKYTTGEFNYQFTMNHETSGSDVVLAEIFVPLQVHYPKGIDVVLEPEQLTYRMDENILSIINNKTNAGEDYNVKISITKL